MFYPSFYVWMDQATHELFRSPAGSFADLFTTSGYGFPIVEATCRFVSQVTRIRHRSFTVEHRFERDTDRLAVGHEVRVFAQPHPDDPGRLVTAEIPDPLRAFILGERDDPV